MLVITIDAAFLPIILSEMIYVVKKLPTLVFLGQFFGYHTGQLVSLSAWIQP